MFWGGLRLVVDRQVKATRAIADNFIQQYPNTQTNDSARTLERLVVDIGFFEFVRDRKDVLNPSLTDKKSEALAAASRDAAAYISAQLIKSQGPLDSLPPTVEAYLVDNLDALNRVEGHLHTEPHPQWGFDAAAFTDFDQPTPSLWNLSELHDLLLLKAVYHSQQSQPEQMLSALDAAQLLTVQHSQSPDLLSYLSHFFSVRSASAVTRHLDDVPAAFAQKLLLDDYLERGLESLRFDNWAMYLASMNSVDSDDFRYDTTVGLFPALPSSRSHFFLSTTNTAQLLDRTYRQLATTDPSYCNNDWQAIENTLFERVPWWNMTGKVTVPGYISQLEKTGDLALSAELTHHIVKAKTLAAEQGQWPNTLPGLASQICPDDRWIYEVGLDGQMSLSFSRELPSRGSIYNDSAVSPLTYSATTYSATLAE